MNILLKVFYNFLGILVSIGAFLSAMALCGAGGEYLFGKDNGFTYGLLSFFVIMVIGLAFCMAYTEEDEPDDIQPLNDAYSNGASWDDVFVEDDTNVAIMPTTVRVVLEVDYTVDMMDYPEGASAREIAFIDGDASDGTFPMDRLRWKIITATFAYSSEEEDADGFDY